MRRFVHPLLTTAALGWLGLSLLALAGGCSRFFYRTQADTDAYFLESQKAGVVGVDQQKYQIQINPRSRMYDPADPDVQPMPPDDPDSHRYMEAVDNKRGSKLWRKLPRTSYVDNPNWQQYLPHNEQGEVQLNMCTAVQTALLESPDYQQQLETLYLSALDVSFERFRFDTQFFGGSEIFLTADGRDRTITGGNSSTLLTVSPLRPANRLQAQRMTATGGELVVGAANSLVWQFAGPNDYNSTTLLDFSLVQPLLRAGGKTVVMERLTIAERTLLGNVRQMERYRDGFYLNIVTGSGGTNGPSRRGGFFGGSGLEGFAGVGSGGFGQVGNAGGGFGFFGGQQGAAGVGGGFTGGAGAATAGGFVGLLQNSQQIRNQRSNVMALRESYDQLAASYDAGRIDKFQVDLARQALYNAQSQLITAQAGYQSQLDVFKITLGLPPDMPARIEDPYLDRFNLIDPRLEEVEDRVSTTLDELRTLREMLRETVESEGGGPLDEQAVAAKYDKLINECLASQAFVEERMSAVAADLAALDAALPKRHEILNRLATRPEVQSAKIDPMLFDAAELDRRTADRRVQFDALRTHISGLWDKLRQLEANRQPPMEQLSPLVDTMADLSGRLLELSLVQAGARLEAVTFDPIELSGEDAMLIASAYRQDWQNARASLVDTWRLIYFNANALRSNINLLFSGDVGNVGQNPFDLRSTKGRLRVGAQFDAPLTRVSERNIYRQSLIEYQQARRSYYRFRDGVSRTLRAELRQLHLDEINFELRRAAVLVAISQVDLTQLRLSEPPQASAAPAAGTAVVAPTQFNNTTARDLVQSLSDLLNVQNDFMSVWVNYEVQRMSLEFDLGVLELDQCGMRVEKKTPLSDYVAGAEAIRQQICNLTDLYPGVGQVLQLDPMGSPAGKGTGLDFPEGIGPTEGTPAGPAGTTPAEPLPPPLVNPAANGTAPVGGTVAAAGPYDRIVLAAATSPKTPGTVEQPAAGTQVISPYAGIPIPQPPSASPAAP